MLVVAYAREAAADASGRECLKQARMCARLTRQFIARSVHNHQLLRMRAMQADPQRRAQVLSDLGGEAALLRWEARLKRARKRAIFRAAQARHQGQNGRGFSPVSSGQNPHKSSVLGREKTRFKSQFERYPNMFYDPCRLDRTGVFRLAAIRRVGLSLTAIQDRAAPRGVPRAGVLRREGRVRYLSGLRAPIPLTPRDLRLRVRGAAPGWGPPVRAASGGGGLGPYPSSAGKPP